MVVRLCELLELEGSKLAVSWSSHAMHGQCVMELFDPLAHNALNCIVFHRGVFIESYLTYNFSLIFLGSTGACLLGSKVTQV